MQKYHDTKYDKFYMCQAVLASKNSNSARKQVGTCIVLPNGLISMGWNGTPSGFSNVCEDGNGLTKATVIHAEINALKKLLVAGVSTKGARVFCTYSPCVHCAVQLVDIGLSEFVYMNEYKDPEGLLILRASGITVRSMEWY